MAALPDEHWAENPGAAEAVEEVLSADGLEQVRTWVARQIEKPGFDRAQSQMPVLGVSRREAEIISRHIVKDAPSELDLMIEPLTRALQPLRLRHLLYAYLIGVVSAVAALAVLLAIRARRRPGRAA